MGLENDAFQVHVISSCKSHHFCLPCQFFWSVYFEIFTDSVQWSLGTGQMRFLKKDAKRSASSQDVDFNYWCVQNMSELPVLQCCSRWGRSGSAILVLLSLVSTPQVSVGKHREPPAETMLVWNQLVSLQAITTWNNKHQIKSMISMIIPRSYNEIKPSLFSGTGPGKLYSSCPGKARNPLQLCQPKNVVMKFLMNHSVSAFQKCF